MSGWGWQTGLLDWRFDLLHPADQQPQVAGQLEHVLCADPEVIGRGNQFPC